MFTHRLCRFVLPVVAPFCIATAAAGPVDLKDSRVRVPWPDFKRIVELVAQRDSAPKTDTAFAPRDFLITSLSISGTVTGEKAAGLDAELVLHVFATEALKKSGWVKIPVGETGNAAERAVVSGAESGGRSVPIQNEGGTLFLLMPRQGTFTVRLSYTCPVINSEGTSRLFCNLPYASAGYLDINVPGRRVEVKINDVARPSAVNRDGTRIRCAFVAGGDCSIVLSPLGGETAEDAGLQMSPKVIATTGMLVSIKENQVRYRYRVDYRIWHKKATSFSVEMPDSLPIEQVEGAGIQDWKVERAAAKTVVTVRTNFTPEKEYSFTVDFSQKLDCASGVVRVPELTVLGINRENGYLAVQAAQTIEVLGDDSTRGLTSADPREIPAWMRQERDLLMQFKYNKHPCRLFLDIKRHTDMPVLVAIADEAHFQAQFTRDGYALAKFTYMIRNNHKQYLQATLPGGWKLWSALIDGSAVMPAAGGDDSCRVMIPLKKTAGSEEGSGFVLELVYWKEYGAMRWLGGFSFEMPVIDINCRQLSGEIRVPPRYAYSGFKGTMKKVGAYSSRFLDSYNRESHRTDNQTGWQTQQRNYLSNQVQMKTGKQAPALPVEIDVPASGIRFNFSKSLTVAGEKSGLSFGYRKTIPVPDAASVPAWIAAMLTGFFACALVMRKGSVKRRAVIAFIGVFACLAELAVNELAGINAPGIFPLCVAGAIAALLNHFARLPKRIPSAAVMIAAAALLIGNAASVKASEDESGPDLGATSIAIPWSDFKTILDKIERRHIPDTGRTAPPCDYVVSLARFDAEKSGERECAIHALLSITILKSDGWAEVPLGGACAMYPGVTLNGAPAPLGKNENGENVALIKGAGGYELAYRFAAPISENAGCRTIEFPVPPRAAAASFSIVLDDGGYAVIANGRRCAARPAGGQRFAYYGGLGSGDNASVSWQREVSQIGTTAALLIGQAETFYSIGMGLVEVRSAINLTILHHNIRHFTIAVPGSVDIIDLTGPAVAAWESVDSAGQRFVKAVFNYNVRGATAVTLTAEQPYGDSVSRLLLPAITLPGAARQEGYIGIGVISTVELTPDDHSPNVVRKDKRELPASFESLGDALYAYQYLSGGYSIRFNLHHHRTLAALSALVTGQYVQSVIRDDGKTITRIEMTVKNRGEQFLRLRWRANWQLWSLFCNEKATRPAYDSASGELLAPLEKSTDASAETKVKIVYLSTGEKFGRLGGRTIDYPAAGMPVQNCHGSVYIPANVSPFHYGGNLKAEEDKGKPLLSLFWPDLFNPVYIATDFCQKAPEERIAKLERAPEAPRETKKALRSDVKMLHKRKAAGGTTGGGDDPRTRVSRSGVLGVLSGKEAADAGEASLLPHSAPPPLAPAFASGTAESGLLSIPVDISFEGASKTFNAVMLKSGEAPKLTFFYRKVPERTPFIVGAIIFLCMLAAASFLTKGVWAGWSKRLVLYGIAAPFAAAFLLARLVDIPLSCNLLWIVPALFFLWKSIAGIRVWVGSRKKIERETDATLREIAKAQPVIAGVSPASGGSDPAPGVEESKPAP